MIRFPVFAVLGPLAGYFVFIGLGGGIKGDSAGIIFGMLLPVAWIAGLVPASITAALDQLFERLGARSVQRYLLTGIIGYASAYLFMVENYFEIECGHLLVRHRKAGNSSLASESSTSEKTYLRHRRGRMAHVYLWHFSDPARCPTQVRNAAQSCRSRVSVSGGEAEMPHRQAEVAF